VNEIINEIDKSSIYSISSVAVVTNMKRGFLILGGGKGLVNIFARDSVVYIIFNSSPKPLPAMMYPMEHINYIRR
jgi:hypothetical protein